MSPESEQFEQLRRLLALKRYEQPPPAFFNQFSRQVIARIEIDSRRGTLKASLEQVSWLQRFWTALETKPVFAGAFGASICGLLITGMIYSSQVERIETEATALVPVSTAEYQPVQFADAPEIPGFRDIATPEASSNGNLLPPQIRNSLFEEFRNSQQNFRVQPVSAGAP